MKAYRISTALPITPLSIPTLNALTKIHDQAQPWYPEQPKIGIEYCVMFYDVIEAGDEEGAIQEAERQAYERLKLPPWKYLVLLGNEINFDSVADEMPHDPAKWMRAQGARPLFPELV